MRAFEDEWQVLCVKNQPGNSIGMDMQGETEKAKRSESVHIFSELIYLTKKKQIDVCVCDVSFHGCSKDDFLVFEGTRPGTYIQERAL